MRATASILHLDLDAFFASVEQRDKPSLRGKPVVVGGLGPRGVVATASYAARVFGVRSAMAMSEARRRCPNAAYVYGRFGEYRRTSRVVMGLLRELSPLVEPLSIDEAYVDLAAGGCDVADLAAIQAVVEKLRADVTERTGGLTASVGVGSSKFMAKVASELAKPDGWRIIAPGDEVATIAPLPARAIPGVGPVTMDKLSRLGLATVADVQRASEKELIRELGKVSGEALYRLAFAADDRRVEPDRETKSISHEETFDIDIREPSALIAAIDDQARRVSDRMVRAHLFARTVTIKVRLGDFSTFTRSRTLLGATDRAEVVRDVAESLLGGLNVKGGVRLLGVGVANFTDVAQEELFWTPLVDSDLSGWQRSSAGAKPGALFDEAGDGAVGVVGAGPSESGVDLATPTQTSAIDTGSGSDPAQAPLGGGAVPVRQYRAGQDVIHTEFGRGWVWGAGKGVVTVRFETATSGVGPVRSFPVDAPELMHWSPEPDSS